jgi:hypothetical protein
MAEVVPQQRVLRRGVSEHNVLKRLSRALSSKNVRDVDLSTSASTVPTYREDDHPPPPLSLSYGRVATLQQQQTPRSEPAQSPRAESPGRKGGSFLGRLFQSTPRDGSPLLPPVPVPPTSPVPAVRWKPLYPEQDIETYWETAELARLQLEVDAAKAKYGKPQ